MLTLLENTMLPMDYCNTYPYNERPERAMALLRRVGLENQAGKMPLAVSTGQQQSAAIARGLATDPPILIADEPSGNLDSHAAEEIIDLFAELARQGKTIVMVTHDPSLTERTTHKVTLADGRIIEDQILDPQSVLPKTDRRGSVLRPRWRKTLSDLWDNKIRTLLVVVSIAVGVFSVGMIAGAYSIISSDMSKSYAASNPANIDLTTGDFDQTLVTSIHAIPGVAKAEGRRFTSLQVRVSGGQWINITLIAESNFTQSTLDLLEPLAGSAIPGDRQVLVERSFLKKVSAAVGDTLEFKLADGTTRTMPVVGVVLDQSTNAGDFLASPLLYVTTATLDWLHQPETFNHLLVTVSSQADNSNHIRQIAQSITDQLQKKRGVRCTATRSP